MDVFDVIHSRHSYRGRYKDIPVPKEDLIRIMQAGLDAPSGCNKQTTSLIAVDDPEVLAKLHNVIDPPVGETAPAAICVLTKRINAYRDRCFAVHRKGRERKRSRKEHGSIRFRWTDKWHGLSGIFWTEGWYGQLVSSGQMAAGVNWYYLDGWLKIYLHIVLLRVDHEERKS